MTTTYPNSYQKGGTRKLSPQDFPPVSKVPTADALLYLARRQIERATVEDNPFAYFTPLGIAFLTYGAVSSAFQVRYLPPMGSQRFGFPKGVDMSDHLFYSSPFLGQRGIVIVEGSTDALAVGQESNNELLGVSLLGANLTKERVAHLRTFLEGVRCYYVPDNDAPGKATVLKIKQAQLPLTIIYLPPDVKDLCELNSADRKDFLNEL